MRLGGSTWTENILSANHLNDAMRSHERRIKFALRSTFARLYQGFHIIFRRFALETKLKSNKRPLIR
ncbi:hypothetical protein QBD01_002418 [Ochrobactrum sp. 19YEA23]|nr:hypothetical protein [Ochrobactrum sp. 19YEA23]